MAGRNSQTVARTNRGSLKSSAGNELKDVEIIAINPPNAKKEKIFINVHNNNSSSSSSSNNNNKKPQSSLLNINAKPREQVNTLSCNCLQCEAGVVNLNNPVNASSPTPIFYWM